MKCILYARFSPRPNAAECESCARQLEDLRAWARDNGYEVVGEFHDDALSGGDDWSERPGMLDAVKIASRGMVFLVRAYDRLFRDTDKALAFRAMLEARGVEVRSITEPAANGDSMNAKLIRFVFLWIAEYQREITRARTKTRMLAHQQAGRRMSARLPWGWAADPADAARMVPCEQERDIAKLAGELRAAGLGLRAIARELDARGLRRREGQTWTHTAVRRILAGGQG
jgi:DNA invertase Pin-like site-specific DNA recombinase